MGRKWDSVQKTGPTKSIGWSDTMRDIPKLAMSRYGIDYDMPVGIELKIGQNWLDLNPVEL